MRPPARFRHSAVGACRKCHCCSSIRGTSVSNEWATVRTWSLCEPARAVADVPPGGGWSSSGLSALRRRWASLPLSNARKALLRAMVGASTLPGSRPGMRPGRLGRGRDEVPKQSRMRPLSHLSNQPTVCLLGSRSAGGCRATPLSCDAHGGARVAEDRRGCSSEVPGTPRSMECAASVGRRRTVRSSR